MDPIEDMAEKKMSPTALAERLFMMARIWLLEFPYNALAMATIDDHLFISPKSWLQPKFQR